MTIVDKTSILKKRGDFFGKKREYNIETSKEMNKYVLDKSRKTKYEIEKRKVPKDLTDLSAFAYEFKKPTP